MTGPEPLAPLSGIVVLDATSGVAGQFAGRLFADHGASVTLAEPLGGSATRRIGPFAPAGPGGSDVSCTFEHLNAGKASMLVDTATAEGRDGLQRHAAASHVVITDDDTVFAPLLNGSEPRVSCRISGFGADTPLASWRGNELVFQALSGTMHENGLAGREPLFGVGHRASYAAGTIAYTQACALLLASTPRRATVDVSIAEVAASMTFNRVTQYSYNGTVEGRAARTTPRAMVRCLDGWVAVFIYDHRWRQSCMALGLEALVDDPRFVEEETRLANWDAFTEALGKILGTRTVDDVVTAGQRDKVVVAKAFTPFDLWTDPHLRARGFWNWSNAATDALVRLGPMFTFSGTPQPDRGGAPALGTAHLGAPAVLTRLPLDAPAPLDDPRPLSDVSVLDLTTAWSGPMATRLLASLGARVIKVEGPGRIDDWRGPVAGGLPSRYPDLDPGERPFDRCYQFNTQNHDKLGVTLDLKNPAGLALAKRLAADADVVIANFSSGTLDRMGLGWSTIQAINPRAVLVEMPAYGAGGPMAHHVALGPSMEMTSGMASLIGYGDGRPTTTGPAYLDPIGGFNAAVAVVTALAARRATGSGQHVEMAQRDAAMHWIGEEVVHAVATGTEPTPQGNQRPEMAPHDAFPADGADQWVVIAADSDVAFATLWAVLDVEGSAAQSGFATLQQRHERLAELTDLISSRTRTRDKHELATSLQAHGVLAAPVNDASDLATSPFLASRGLLQLVDHPAAGKHAYQGVPLHISGLDLAIRRPAPTFSEHTATVLREHLGLDEAAILELEIAGVISARPRLALVER
jgi:crotonobetainyl-CoA:carnitine CoA-transferase CaiB-like acyl-CoA transferase